MIDYKALEALAMVIQMNSFEIAARKLHITQSAVSQRVKSLENYFGMPLLQRTQPYQPTQYGQLLINHYRKTSLLEVDVSEQFHQQVKRPKLSIAINRDSMDTWFYHALRKLDILAETQLEIKADDQEVTIDYFKRGLVSGCVSTQEKAVFGCQVDYLGIMEYKLVATPEFYKRYFNKKRPLEENILAAPAVIFDINDHLHKHYLERYFSIYDKEPNYHIAPSVQCFRSFVIAGYGCALIPELDIADKLQQKVLVEICPKKTWRMPLYWHSWNIQSTFYRDFSNIIIDTAKQYLQ